MKKIISLIIVAAMLVMMLPVFAEGDNGIAALCEETGLLQTLGIYSQSDALDTSDKAVTRGEFAVYAARLLSLNEEAYVNTRYFKDVPSSRREAGAINALNDRGIMIGTGNYEFDIDGLITPADAASILLKITGYPQIYLDNKPMPRKRIMAGVEGLQTVTKRQLATMIYNMLSLPYLDLTGITVENAQFEIDEDYTVMEALFDVYRIKGRLTAAEGSGINGVGVSDNSTAVINNVIYRNAYSDTYESIGMYVSAYIKVTKETEGMNTLTYLWADTTDVIEIKADQFVSVSGNYQISYTADNENRVRNVTLPSNVKVIKNGALEKDNVKSALDIKNGSMKLIKNDKGVYDVAIVSVFEAAMVTAVDTEFKKVYVKGKTPIDLSNDFQKIKIFDETGNAIELTDLRAGKFISYFVSDVSAKIYVCDKIVSGKIERLSTKSNNVSITVAGGTVFVDNEYYKANKDKFQIGTNGTFYCDYDGKIAYAVKGGAEGKFAYVLGADIDELSDIFTLWVYDQSGEFIELKTNTNKVNLDGNRVSGQQAYSALTSNGKAVNRLIRYKTTSDGKLNFIDTAETYNKATEGENSLQKPVDAKSLIYLSTSKSMGVILPIGPSTVVMQIPKENGQLSYNQKDYAINPTFVGYKTYTVDAYTTNPDSIFPDVVISGLVETQDSVSCYVFDSIYETLNSEGDVDKVLKLGGEKGIENLTVSADFVAVSEADRASGYVLWDELGAGDVVRIVQNGRGEVTKIGLVLDYDKDTSINTNMLSSYGQYEKWNTENFGFVKKVESGYYKYGERDSDAKDEILPLTSNTIVVFDSSKREDKVYMGSEKDIYSKEDVGANASAILTNQKNGISIFTIVFKNGADLFKVQ